MNNIINIAIYITPNTITAINIPKLVLLEELLTVSKLLKKSFIKETIASLISLTDVLA